MKRYIERQASDIKLSSSQFASLLTLAAVMSDRVSTGIHGWMNEVHKSNMFKMRIERFPALRIWLY